ncbi:cell wall-binding repeat-containing protein [Peptoclostridium sp. AF21-18]|uniref:cell wall-binding repeat-containing protein n=1 Tax=Peptoclostridium sp. AF21-18 TaxID=2292243 RepID=UPI000E4E789A|nr:cell wall-binding repeat-containing protein [Peptoclostridium sp. AF21-18]RHQ98989.1 cell wall-binding repeat-containing protein [Peptoclostridium sp. AF21-18]
MKKKLATVMAATMAVSGSVVSVSAATTEDKIVGSNRTDTAVRISKEGWKSAETAILVNDSAIPDALTATPLAHAKNAPILLTGKDGLNKATADEIKRLGAKDVIMIGGDAVLPAKVEKDLKALNVKVDRIKGETREETALAIAKRLDGIKDVSEIAVVNGTTGLADAVSVAAAAAEKGMPILLANPKKGLSAAEKFIKDEAIKASFVIGGKTALPEKLVSSLPGKQRIEGSNRNDTNAKVIEKFYGDKELDNLYLAKDGRDGDTQLIDALAVGALAAKNGAPVLIASKKLSSAQVDVINTKKIDTITQVGGKGNEGAFNQLKDIEKEDVYEVGTVEELKEALANANANDKIVLKPNATITEDIIISTDKNVDIKVEGTITGKVDIDVPNGSVANNSTSKPSTGGGSSSGGSTGGNTGGSTEENKFELTYDGEYDLTPLHIEVGAADGVKLKIVEKEGNKDVTNDFIKEIKNDSDNDLYKMTLKKPLAKDVVYQIVAEKGSNTAKVEISTKKDFIYVPVSEKDKLYDVDQFEGKTVVLDGTDYELAKQIKITKPLEIMGDFDYDVEKPVLKASGTWTATGKGDASIILVSGAKGVKLTNIDVTGAKDVNYTDNSKAKTAYGIGINLFKSEVYLDNVFSYNNAGAGFVVNGSTLKGEGVITNENGWGGINVDKGSGVTEKCIIDLNIAVLNEKFPVYSDSVSEDYLKDIEVNVIGEESKEVYNKQTVNGKTVWSPYTISAQEKNNITKIDEELNGDVNGTLSASFEWGSSEQIGTNKVEDNNGLSYYSNGAYLRLQVKKGNEVKKFDEVFKTGEKDHSVGDGCGLTLKTTIIGNNSHTPKEDDMDGSAREKADWTNNLAAFNSTKLDNSTKDKYIFYGVRYDMKTGTRTVGFNKGDMRTIDMKLRPKSGLEKGIYTVTIQSMEQVDSNQNTVTDKTGNTITYTFEVK